MINQMNGRSHRGGVTLSWTFEKDPKALHKCSNIEGNTLSISRLLFLLFLVLGNTVVSQTIVAKR